MKYRGFNIKRRGYLWVETLVSISLLAVLTAVAGKAFVDYGRTRDHYLWRQSAMLAADAQLQRYQAGAALDSKPPEAIIPDNIVLATAMKPGRDQWQDFKLVTVTASVIFDDKEMVHEQVSGYVRAEVTP